MRSFFKSNGLLSRFHPNYEFRPGQLEMAEAVEAALQESRHLIVEAGTGTGKTLAYLVPAILSGKRVVVSTGTKNLQEQLYFKDVPFLQTLFEKPLSVCYMKGRANYVCRQKVYDAEREPMLSGFEEIGDFRKIRDWERTTESGDRSELVALRENSSTWHKLDARSDLCPGQKCKQFDRCFITEMHRRASASDIIIVNHHLFFADLAVRDDPYAGILPDYHAVIFDEAHEIEDVAGQYFGVSISNLQIQELVKDTSAIARRKYFATPELDRALIYLNERTERFFSIFPQEGRQGFRDRERLFEEHEDSYRELLLALDLVCSQLELVQNAVEDTLPLVRRGKLFQQALRFWTEGGDATFVYWTDRRGRSLHLQATPIDVAATLRSRLMDRENPVILTSATLTVAGNFEYSQRRLGLENSRTLHVESLFNYGKQALLYVPRHLPDPRQREFTVVAADEIERVLEASRGRAFVLFTSYQQMRQIHEILKDRLEYPVLLQGTAPRTALIDSFRATPNCVLFATSSFWQGVDVQGEQLSCVIVDRLPFAVPTDPVIAARVDAIREAGGNPFYDYQIPQAALALKQGFGRLIRSTSDRGVLVLLDNRIIKLPYGKVFFDSLPAYRFSSRIEDVQEFFHV
ncbi:MAG TPA: ATP-dependent DNA helicase [Bryobacteraceae bacterium]|nr:ATP-dependent DNA helicase [Bryobacteraceae bacterium]